MMIAETEILKQNNCAAAVRTGARVHAAPRVSVVIPAHNIAPYVAESLQSVLAQTFRAFEIILVNDGSDDTAAFEVAIAPFRDEIIYIRQENAGAAAARNAGIRVARGEFLAFLDGDDVWLPEFLQSQIEFLEKNNLDMVYADAAHFGDDVPPGETYMLFSPSDGAVTPESLILWTCNVITSGTIVRRASVVDAGMFDESPLWKRAQDFELWFRLAKRGTRIGYQKRILLKYRIRTGSLSGDRIERAERNVVSLNGLKQKFVLTPTERSAWDKQMRDAQTFMCLEKGKLALARNDFADARNEFAKARQFQKSLKLSFVLFALNFAPGVFARIYRRWLD